MRPGACAFVCKCSVVEVVRLGEELVVEGSECMGPRAMIDDGGKVTDTSLVVCAVAAISHPPPQKAVYDSIPAVSTLVQNPDDTALRSCLQSVLKYDLLNWTFDSFSAELRQLKPVRSLAYTLW